VSYGPASGELILARAKMEASAIVVSVVGFIAWMI
jgi:hypothetical protein